MSSPRTASKPRRRLTRSAALAIALGLFAACGPAPEPDVPIGGAPTPTVSATLTSAPTSPMPPDAPPTSSAPVFDPVPIGMTVEGVTKVCDDHLKAAEALLNDIKALKGAPADKLTFEATFGRFDRMVLELNNAGEFPYLMGVAHPDAAVREAAKKCEPKSEKFTTAMWLDPDLAAVLKAYAAKGEKLEGEKARLVHDVLRDFRRNGLDLPPEKQARLREINEAITKNGQMFISNIGASNETLEVDPKALEGLPPEYIAKHPPNDKGKVVLTTDYPDFFPFMTYARDRKTALKLFVLFQNRGGKKNVELLELILKLRSEKAKLLGYQHWADYATEPRMAK
ncbi:MAG: M3 family metallopeptidase, partial [Polyangiaceae bacterium]|nr:M3 family metallopeptidase [Polyangiaceae bacterium]